MKTISKIPIRLLLVLNLQFCSSESISELKFKCRWQLAPSDKGEKSMSCTFLEPVCRHIRAQTGVLFARADDFGYLTFLNFPDNVYRQYRKSECHVENFLSFSMLLCRIASHLETMVSSGKLS